MTTLSRFRSPAFRAPALERLPFDRVVRGVATTLAMAALLTTPRASASASSRQASPVTPRGVVAKISAKNYTVDFVAGACRAGTECTATLKLDALGTFHINDNYPYKFKAQEAPGLEFLSKDAAGTNVFSKQAGDFKKDGAKSATLTVRFKPSKAGTLSLSGQYKLSICSADTCQLEAQEMSVDVDVK